MVGKNKISGFGGLIIKIPTKGVFVDLEVDYIDELIETNFKLDKDGWEIGEPIRVHKGFEVHCVNGHVEKFGFFSDITTNLFNKKVLRCPEHPNDDTYTSVTGDICCIRCFNVINEIKK